MNKLGFLLLFILLFTTQINLFAEMTKYAGEFFKMGAGVRNFSMGRTGLTDSSSPAVAYWNSSLLLIQENRTFELMHSEEFHGLLKYDTISGSFGENHRIGFTLARIGVNDVPLTRLPKPEEPPGDDNKPYAYKHVNNSEYILYLGFARKLGNIPLGITPKLFYKDLAGTSAFGFGADIGTHLQANQYFTFGARVRDIIPTQIYWDNGTTEYVYPGLDLETQFHIFMPVIDKPLNIYINGEVNFEGMNRSATVNVGEISLDPHFGAELILHPMVSFFAGYDIENFTTGIGISYNQFLLNYAFEQNSGLDNSHRFSIGYRF
ncbi:MAG: hypothetical protein FWG98_02765 [Candidatus Cloacimonetes bacterium]|nr:hypothetical protein [Candidatus Cloacimonadota bacterium]